MSYDVWLEAELGGDEPVTWGNWNYTSNCGPMWRAAGADLAEFHGKNADECAEVLRRAIAEMRANPAKYRAMDPSNGWGSYDSLVPALEELRLQFLKAPHARVVVSR